VLTATKQWTDATKNLESIRVIAAGSPPAALSNEQALPTPPANIKEAEEMLEMYRKVYTKGMTPADEANFRAEYDRRVKEIARVYKEQGRESELTQLSQYAVALLTQGETKLQNLFKPSSRMALLISLQDGSGAYLIGWQAEQVDNKWMFDGAPTREDTRGRASEWDGIGMAAFAIKAPDTSRPVEKPKPAEAPKGDAPSGGGRPGGSGG